MSSHSQSTSLGRLPETREVDPKPRAAAELGFYIGCWATDVLTDALTTLFSDIHPNLYTALGQELTRVDSYIVAEQAKVNESLVRCDGPPHPAPYYWMTTSFRKMADEAIRGKAYFAWYTLGAAVGDLYAHSTTAHSTTWVVATNINDRPVPARRPRRKIVPLGVDDAIRLLRIIDDLPHDELQQVAVLKELVSLATEPVGLDELLAAILPSSPRDTPRLLKDFFRAIADDLGKISRPVITKANPQAERNKWIYDQCCGPKHYEDIIRELKTQCTQKPDWRRIKTTPGLKNAAAQYARDNDLPRPPEREPGRPQKN
ncbi:MAG: hypothetical protein K8T91_05765 [Planctomycetes bacterium]|nr:hypothetical protein [Planctomycetota bacterium]